MILEEEYMKSVKTTCIEDVDDEVDDSGPGEKVYRDRTICSFVLSGYLQAVYRTQLGSQKEHSAKTLHSSFSTQFWDWFIMCWVTELNAALCFDPNQSGPDKFK